MTTFVLIHGSTHSPCAWDLVKAQLEIRQQKIITPELPAEEPDAGANRYADVIADAFSEDEHPIVVAHSAAGWFLPLVATHRRVRRMVFLAATVPRIGSSFLERLKDEPEMINPVWIGKDPRTETVANEFLLHDCPPNRLKWAHATIRVMNARRVLVERYPLEQWPAVPSSYIVCAEDRTINPVWSRRIARSELGAEPLELPGGHCPYISRPAELAEMLMQIQNLDRR